MFSIPEIKIPCHSYIHSFNSFKGVFSVFISEKSAIISVADVGIRMPTDLQKLIYKEAGLDWPRFEPRTIRQGSAHSNSRTNFTHNGIYKFQIPVR